MQQVRTWEKYEDMPKDVMVVQGADGHRWERVMPRSEHAWRRVYPDEMGGSTVSPYDHRMMPCTEVLPTEPESTSIVAADSAERRVDAVLRRYFRSADHNGLVHPDQYSEMLVEVVDAVRRADAGESPTHDELWTALRTSINTTSSLVDHLSIERDEVARLKHEVNELRGES